MIIMIMKYRMHFCDKREVHKSGAILEDATLEISNV